jgi:hypothetical protein
MYTTNLEVFKTQQQELHRRAEHYRLVKSLEKTRSPWVGIYTALGNALIILGQSLLKRTQAAH